MQSASSLKIREVSSYPREEITTRRTRAIYAWNNSVVEGKMKRLLEDLRAEDTKTKVQGHL